ncbi:MAG: hypothetical protein IJT14_01195 [Rickettsiales bacterium]|nr:hypothetical protein [Rickettsiales bacterium]
MSLLFGEQPAERTNSDDKTKKKTTKEPKVKLIEDKQEISKELREIKQIHSFDAVGERILQQFQDDKLHHATMLSGSFGIGKATFAYWLICQMILSKAQNEDMRQANLQLLQENRHPDVFILQSSDGKEISVENVRELLDGFLSLKSTYGYKFVLIDDINSVNANGVNALLKSLEEPTKNTFFFIINHKISTLLDTIYSRCNEEKLTLSSSDCRKILTQQHDELTADEISIYTDMSENSVAFANILISLNVCKMAVFLLDYNEINETNIIIIANKIKQAINNLWTVVDTNFKTLPRILKISLLEKIIYYFISRLQKIGTTSDNMQKIVVLSNTLTKQFIDIKQFELPVRF